MDWPNARSLACFHRLFLSGKRDCSQSISLSIRIRNIELKIYAPLTLSGCSVARSEICPGLNPTTKITKTAKIRKGAKNGLQDVRGAQRELPIFQKLRELRKLRKFTQRYQEWLRCQWGQRELRILGKQEKPQRH